MYVIIECISWLIKVTDKNDAQWKPEIKYLGLYEWNCNQFTASENTRI